MPSLYYNALTPTIITSATAASGFPVANVAIKSLKREWQSVGVGNDFIRLDFGSMVRARGVFAHGVNFDTPLFFGIDAALNNWLSLSTAAYQDGLMRSRVMVPCDLMLQRAQFNPSGLIGNVGATLKFSAVAQGYSANKYIYQTILSPSYTILAGQSLRYDVLVDAANPAIDASGAGAGGMDLVFASGSPGSAGSIPCVDQQSRSILFEPTITARGVWQSRVISLTPAVGRVIGGVSLVNENDKIGKHSATYRNIRISNASDVDALVIWRGGNTPVNALQGSIEYFDAKIVTQGSPSDSAAFWRCGSMTVFQDVVKLAPAPDKNYVADYAHAQQSQKIINGNTAVWGVGATRREISLEWLRKYPEQLQTVLTETRKGICVLDMENPLMPENVWPVMCLDERLGSRFPRNNSEILTGMKLTEVC